MLLDGTRRSCGSAPYPLLRMGVYIIIKVPKKAIESGRMGLVLPLYSIGYYNCYIPFDVHS